MHQSIDRNLISRRGPAERSITHTHTGKDECDSVVLFMNWKIRLRLQKPISVGKFCFDANGPTDQRVHRNTQLLAISSSAFCSTGHRSTCISFFFLFAGLFAFFLSQNPSEQRSNESPGTDFAYFVRSHSVRARARCASFDGRKNGFESITYSSTRPANNESQQIPMKQKTANGC